MDLTLVTCLDMPETDLDESPLLEALAAAGVDARMAAWDDPEVDWSGSPLTVIRSTWNYSAHRDEFLDWLRRVGAARTVVRNPASTVAPNTHKSYLAGLERAELPVVPTRWFARGGRAADHDSIRNLPWRHVVCKPAIGGGSCGVRAFDLEEDGGVEAASTHVQTLQRSTEVLVQPRLRSIVERGELDIVWIDGECTHVVTKLSRLEGQDERVTRTRAPTEEEVALATRALRAVPAYAQRELLYARVDVAPDDLGTLRIIELEVVEPSLFVALHEPAMQRLVRALVRECGMTR